MLTVATKHSDDFSRYDTDASLAMQDSLFTLETLSRDFPIVPKSIFSETLKGFFTDARVWAGFEHAHSLRSFFKQPLERIYKGFAKDLNFEKSNILELGSGVLSGNGDSYLSGMLPHASWTFSDIPAYASKYSQFSQEKPYIPIDLSSSSNKANRSFQCIIGSSVLDTLPYRDLSQAFRTISEILEPNGVLVHVADLDFFFNAFYDACACENEGAVLLPAGWRPELVYRIDKKEFGRVLAEKKSILSSEERTFFTKWGESHIQFQASALIQLHGKKIAGREQLAKRVDHIFAPSLEMISCVEIFERYLKQAAEENGFSVTNCGYVTELFSRDALPDEKDNYYKKTPTGIYSRKAYVVAPEKVLIEVATHVFVARIIKK